MKIPMIHRLTMYQAEHQVLHTHHFILPHHGVMHSH